MTQSLFVYGSLVERRELLTLLETHGLPPVVEPCAVTGFRREWNVAMDNRGDLPRYKYYVDRASGERPACYVTFLNLRRHSGGRVNGVAITVDEALLSELDGRERNYRRIRVDDAVEGGPAGTIWAYVGTPDAEARYREGLRTGTGLIARAYHEGVDRAFRGWGARFHQQFLESTVPPDVPLAELVRVDLP